jgi:hypothetical protein
MKRGIQQIRNWNYTRKCAIVRVLNGIGRSHESLNLWVRRSNQGFANNERSSDWYKLNMYFRLVDVTAFLSSLALLGYPALAERLT